MAQLESNSPAAGAMRVLILGANSGIAEATARLYAAEGVALLLVGRHANRLNALADQLRKLGASRCESTTLDLVAADPTTELPALVAQLGGVDHLHIAYAIMPEQSVAAVDLAVAARMMTTNYTSTALWSLAAANLLEAQGHGALVVLGSVAGDRGRRKNFIYASTKAGIETLVEGIAHRFAGNPKLRAVVVKPGPTATAMTASSPPGRRLVPAEEVARLVRRAAVHGGPVQYAPRRWRLIMRVVRELPWWLFRRIDL
ncbi:MAG TPA: SDR family NAD(P)-dependent oxidoreductase [Devosia sp.]|jgi:short-subunit dehydrogenase|uniref:SDR family NAD(P)-dependent oxidoreductase n=1 Tax=Devosia sp. TaxID=1871048 RepID=UPI002DDD7A26|nr:SDR family NAD(P)-dependent oxidoreductase [Devosia sp.]HEV2513787.1 SDR family NAD(P)-dependent oxidoreductase [Devosia sp.]